MANRYIYLIRHGKYDSTIPTKNARGTGLLPLGIKQAQITANRIAKEISATNIYYSSMLRAIQTANPILEKFPEIKGISSKLLWECVPGLPNLFKNSYSNVSNERLETDKFRAEKVFKKFFIPASGKDKHDIIVSHGNIIRYLVCRSLQLPAESWNNLAINNCGISKIQILENKKMIVVSHNDTGHLSKEMLT